MNWVHGRGRGPHCAHAKPVPLGVAKVELGVRVVLGILVKNTAAASPDVSNALRDGHAKGSLFKKRGGVGAAALQGHDNVYVGVRGEHSVPITPKDLTDGIGPHPSDNFRDPGNNLVVMGPQFADYKVYA